VLKYELRANGRISTTQVGNKHQLNVDFNFDFNCWLSGSLAPVDPVAQALLNHQTQCAPKPVDCPVHDCTTATNSKQRCVEQSVPCAAEEKANFGAQPDGQSRCPEQAAPCPAEGKVDTQTEKKGYVPSSHRLSYSSTKVLCALDSTNEQLSCIENRVEAISAILCHADRNEIHQVKSELAQLETKAKQLETKGVDDVYTGELHSGKQVAKDTKKDMLARFEKLFAKLDEAFAACKLISAFVR